MNPTNLKSLLAASSAVQSEVDEAGLGAVTEESSAITLYDRIILHPEVRAVTRDLYRDGYYSMSVEQCFKFINKTVKERISSDKDGTGLMFAALGSDSPALQLNAMQTQSEKDEQGGYTQIFAGCMLGVRNPRAHEPDWPEDPVTALELITLGQHLMRKLDTAQAARATPARTGSS